MTDDGVVLVSDQDVADQVEAGYSVGEAEDIADHDEGKHDEESEPGCPRCDELTRRPDPMFTYRVRVYTRNASDLAGLFDQLRYDQAQVIDWDHVSDVRSPIGEHYTLTLRSRVVTTDRWASFGLVVTDIREA